MRTLNSCWRWLVLHSTSAVSQTLNTSTPTTLFKFGVQFSSVAQSCLTFCDPMNRSTTGLLVHHQLLSWVYPNSCPLNQWCHPTISSSVVPFSSCPKPFPASGSFQMSHLFTSGSQSTGVAASTSVLPMNTQDWSPLGWTGWFTLATLRMREIPGHWKADKLWIAYLQDFEHLSRNQLTPF